MVYKLCNIHNPSFIKQDNPVNCAVWAVPFLDFNIVGLYPNRGMDANVFSMFILFCEVRGLVTDRNPARWVLPYALKYDLVLPKKRDSWLYLTSRAADQL
jgi:hypothetical protein